MKKQKTKKCDSCSRREASSGISQTLESSDQDLKNCDNYVK